MLRALLRRVRYLPDRLLHGSRRRAALRSLEGRQIRRVLFVCHGNINRSVYAAAIFDRSVPADLRNAVTVESAGFIGSGRPASTTTQALAKARGADVSGHRSRLIADIELNVIDLVIVMDARQGRAISRWLRDSATLIILGDLDPHPVDRRMIEDPYGHAVEVFERVFDRLDRCADALSRAVWAR